MNQRETNQRFSLKVGHFLLLLVCLLLVSSSYGATFQGSVSANNDNCTENTVGTTWSRVGPGNLYVGRFSSSYAALNFGAIFRNVTIPQGATITEAYISLYLRAEGDGQPVVSRIFGFDEDSVSDFGESLPAAKAQTSAYTDWTIDGPEGQWDQSPNISSIVQEIVNRSGWSDGNAMGFVIAENGTSGDYEVKPGNYADNASLATQITIVYSSGNQDPTAVINANPTSGNAPLTVNFNGTESSDPDSDPLTYSWNFGDGQNGSGATPSNQYTSAGNYTVTLTVDDGNGGTDDATTQINVTAPPPTYTVTYYGNGATGGSPPNDPNSYEQGENVQVLGNTNNMERTNFTFEDRWTTAPDGSGNSYNVDQTFSMGTANVSLYAVWNQVVTPTITVTAPNGGENWTTGTAYDITWSTTGSVGNVRIEYSLNNGSSWTNVIANTANNGTYNWTTPSTPATNCLIRIADVSNGSVTDQSNQPFTITTQQQPTYTITYNANGAESGSVPTDPTNYEQGTTVTVLGNSGELAQAGFVFQGWNTASNGNGNTYRATETFLMGNVDVVLYALWVEEGPTAYVYPQECGPNENMEVDGKVKCDAVVIGDWTLRTPDYVFEKDYNLRSIEQLKNYLETNKHLPEVPSAKNMKENGVNLSKLNMILLKKIEELHLYLLQQNKRVEEQQKEIEQFRAILGK